MLRNKQQDLSRYHVKEHMLYISYSEKFIKYIEIRMNYTSGSALTAKLLQKA